MACGRSSDSLDLARAKLENLALWFKKWKRYLDEGHLAAVARIPGDVDRWLAALVLSGWLVPMKTPDGRIVYKLGRKWIVVNHVRE